MANPKFPAKGTANYDFVTGNLAGIMITTTIDYFSLHEDFTCTSSPVTDYQLGMETGKGYWDVTLQHVKIPADIKVFLRYHDGQCNNEIPLQASARLENPHGIVRTDLEAYPHTFVKSNAEHVCCELPGYQDGLFLEGSVLIRVWVTLRESWYTRSFKSHVNGAFLRRNMSELYFSKRLSDFTLVSSDEREHKVHRCVLDAGSPVFRAMFDTNMTEKVSGISTITDVDGQTLDFLLRFLYGIDISSALDDIAEELLIAADKYQIPDLKFACSAHLSENIEPQNAARLLILADEMCLPVLTAATLQLIGGCFTAFKASGGMDCLREHEHGKLLMQVMDYLGTRVEKSRKRTAAEADL